MEENAANYAGSGGATLILLIILYRGAKLLPGQTGSKSTYYILLFALSFCVTLLLGIYIRFETALTNPLFVTLAFMAIIHSGASRLVGIWLEDKNQQTTTIKTNSGDRFTYQLRFYEKLYFSGLGLFLGTALLSTQSFGSIDYIRYWLGLGSPILMAVAKYFQYSEPRLLIGFLLSICSLMFLSPSQARTWVFIAGIAIIIWGMVRVKRKNNAISGLLDDQL